MEKQLAKNILNSRVYVAKEGTFRMKVQSIQMVDGKYIANVNAITPYHQELIKDALAEQNFDAACNAHMSVNIFANASFVPAKGQSILADVANITTKNGVTGLFIVSIAPVPVEATTKVTFDFDEEEGSGENPEDRKLIIKETV